MLENGEADEAVREVITPQLVADATVALEAVNHDLFPLIALPQREAEGVLGEVAGFVALAGGGWERAQRQEFIDQATVEFADVPVSLLVPAIRAARRKVTWAREFVPWVFDAIATDLGKLQAERQKLNRLLIIAQGEAA